MRKSDGWPAFWASSSLAEHDDPWKSFPRRTSVAPVPGRPQPSTSRPAAPRGHGTSGKQRAEEERRQREEDAKREKREAEEAKKAGASLAVWPGMRGVR